MSAAKQPCDVSVEDGYTRWATQYDHDANALIVLEEALALPLLASISATTVLDLGTGTGRYAIRLARQGARAVSYTHLTLPTILLV